MIRALVVLAETNPQSHEDRRMIPLAAVAAIWFFLATYTGASFPQLSGAYSEAQCAGMKQLGEQNNAGVRYACLPVHLPRRDPRCSGAGRYEAMRDGDLSGQGAGHACE